MHAINTRGTLLCMREPILAMRRQGRGGAIVNVSTIGTAFPTIFNNSHYDSSKAGVNALTRTGASAFAKDGIRINAVMPGGVDTEKSRVMQAKVDALPITGLITKPGRMLLGKAQPEELGQHHPVPRQPGIELYDLPYNGSRRRV